MRARPMPARPAGRTVRKALLVRIPVRVLERHGRNRRFVGERQRFVVVDTSFAASAALGGRFFDRNSSRTELSSSTSPTKRNPRLCNVRMRLWSWPLSPSARRAALMRELSVASETAAPVPNRVDQLVLADDPIAVPNKVNEQIEHLRLDVNNRAGAPQLVSRDVDLEIGEAEIQSGPRWLSRMSSSPPSDGLSNRRLLSERSRRTVSRKSSGNLQRDSRRAGVRLQAFHLVCR